MVFYSNNNDDESTEFTVTLAIFYSVGLFLLHNLLFPWSLWPLKPADVIYHSEWIWLAGHDRHTTIENH